MTFNLEDFVSDCKEAVIEPDASSSISEILHNAVSDPEQLYLELGRPERAKIEKLYVSASLTIINVIWAPLMTLLPHNHNMWAVIGVYCGRENNIFWRRIQSDHDGRIETIGAKSLGPGDTRRLGKDIIHSVTNPTSNFAGALHVYGGDFFAVDRSEWDPQTLEELPYDVAKNVRLFEQENARLSIRKTNCI